MLRLMMVLCLVLAPAVTARELVFLVRTGTDSAGNPLFRTADARDGHLLGIFDLTQSSRALQETARYAEAAQEARGGVTQPVFIEVTNGTGNAYNDWQGNFSVTYPDGRTHAMSTPRVVIGLGSDIVRSGNRALLEQTLVHEVGHGVMAQVYGPDSLPQTPWLSRPHSGGTVTDEQLSLIEGWAEFAGAYFTGRRTIAEDPAETLSTNWYARRTDGSLKSASELVRTEGWTATVLYQVATRARDRNAMWKLTDVLGRVRPQSTMQLLAAAGTMYPELAPDISRVLAETSGGQIVDPGFGGGSAPTGGPEQLAGLYEAKRQELAAEPWWRFWVKSRLRREMDEIARGYAQLTAQAQAPAAPDTTSSLPSSYVPDATTPSTARPLHSYVELVKQIGEGGADAADAIGKYRREQARRQRERDGGPRGER